MQPPAVRLKACCNIVKGQAASGKGHEEKGRCIDFRLYLITDRKLFSDDDMMFRGIEQALRGGIDAVQLREKEMETRGLLAMAYRLRELTGKYKARLFINDRVDIAMAVEADGVHLGCSSIPAEAARKVAGERMLIGRSTHSVEEALAAEKAGADFITFGPVFETPSKKQYGEPLGPDMLKKAAGRIALPVFAIGGIKQKTIRDVMAAGAYGIALISGILASDDIQSTTENYVRTIS
ncbi:MAG: thiamine phosphate synthase [Thermodesulfovibrio sp.]|nr:thiamine phosphate synthase [Thermodesulfovibrio sp.]